MNNINFITFFLKVPILKRLIPSLLRLLNFKLKSNIFNFNLYLDLSSSIDREIFLYKTYESNQISFLKKIAKEEKFDFFFDIGSYIGFYALYFENNSNIKNIYAFEPNKTNYIRLKKNIELNNSKIRVFNEGCSNIDSSSKIWFTNKNKTGGSSVFNETDAELKKYDLSKIFFENINLIKLDTKFTFKNSSILAKIDTERHEINVLNGAFNLFSNNKTFLQIEIFTDLKNEVISYLEKNKFRYIHSIRNDYFFCNY